MRELPRGAERSTEGALMMGTFHPSMDTRGPAARRCIKPRLARRQAPRVATGSAAEAAPRPLSLLKMARFPLQITPASPRRHRTGASPAMGLGRMSEQIKMPPLTLQG